MNGLLAGIAFVFFSKSLEKIDASLAKPILSLNITIAVVLGG